MSNISINAVVKYLPLHTAKAYKDIEDVIKQESDLVSVTHKLSPLGVIKG